MKSFIGLAVSRKLLEENTEMPGECEGGDEAGEYAALLEDLSDGLGEKEIGCQEVEATTPPPGKEVRPPAMGRGSLTERTKTYRPLLSPPLLENSDSVNLHA